MVSSSSLYLQSFFFFFLISLVFSVQCSHRLCPVFQQHHYKDGPAVLFFTVQFVRYSTVQAYWNALHFFSQIPDQSGTVCGSLEWTCSFYHLLESQIGQHWIGQHWKRFFFSHPARSRRKGRDEHQQREMKTLGVRKRRTPGERNRNTRRKMHTPGERRLFWM